MADGQVVFEISGDNRSVKDSLRDTTNAIEREGKKWDKAAGESAKGIEDKFTGLFKKISAAAAAATVGKALLDFGKDAVQAASDLAEVQNVVDVTFGDAGAAKIETWAKKAGAQFGLTETQAKRFTSTLGAMMKSAGMAGPEIVNMSTDLAGLAADMASFYNLDFDTAFQKIRSGISGETEPLKQLGINMSVANLEAYALTQGITKAFDTMSQSEQTMLRYQYLMQATADAQGDFARTSDGYANAVRKLETNLEQLKTNAGTVLLPIINNVIAGINSMLEALTATPERTVLDDFADIDLKTEEKLADIEQTAEEARTLVSVLEDIGGKQISADSLTKFVDTLTGKLDGLDAAMKKASDGDYAGTISAISDALASATGVDSSTWETLLTAIGEKLPGAVDAALDDKGQTAAFLEAAAQAADALGGEYPALWGQLLGVLGDDAGAAINALANGATAAEALQALASGANSLSPSVDATKWKGLLDALSGAGAINLPGKDLEEFANALNGTDPTTDRAKAWQELLGALSADAEALSALTGTSAEETAAWLGTLAEGANKLDPNSAEGWDTLFSQFVAGLPGLEGTEFAGLFDGLNGETNTAETYLRALGMETDDIADKQAAWLEVCRRLVQTIPGLSSIINTETGEVKGGADAVRDYIKAWQEGQTKIAMLQALEQKRNAVAERFSDLPGLQLDAALAERRVRQNREKMDAILEKYGFSGARPFDLNSVMAHEYGVSNEDVEAYNELARAEVALEDAAEQAASAYKLQKDALDEAETALEEYGEIVDEMPGEIEAATEATEEWTEAQKTAASEAVTAASEALQAVEKYYQNMADSTLKSVEQVASGFEKIETPAEKARKQMQDLSDQIVELNAAGKDTSGITQQYKAISDSIPTIMNMTDALQSQLDYLNDYQTYLDKARERGVSEDVLASLADGSVESFDYLKELATGAGDIDELNKKYKEVAEAREALAASLTDTKLGADDEFQALVDAAEKAAAGLDVYKTAETAMESTVKGIADGIAAQIPSVTAQVDALNTTLSSLGTIPGMTGANLGVRFRLNGSHAMGLDYVPFDNYLAALHEGESILTAEEAKVWRDFKNGGAASANHIDYDAMGGLMRENIKAGGNVYLNGRVVGEVISAQQGNSLRALERSGWQS